MEEIEYNGYTITKDARLFKISTGKEIMPWISETGRLFYQVGGIRVKMQNIVCEVLFGETATSLLIKCDYMRGFCIADLFNNVKIYPKSDFKNRTKKYIALHNNEPWLFEDNKPKHKSENIRFELNL